MNKLISLERLAYVTLAAGFLGLAGCGNGNRQIDGELTGYGERPGWTQYIPQGMTVIPSGTFHMGQSDEDVAQTMINFNKQITIGGFYMDDTEITNNEYRQFTEFWSPVAMAAGGSDTTGLMRMFTQAQTKQLLDPKRPYYPDTTTWEKDFTHHLGDPLVQYYYAHPAFDDYPVVGVSWNAAKLFCAWRTAYLNRARINNEEAIMPNFRLPSEAEWEYAARGGRDLSPYPWGGPYIRNTKGCLLANFKPGRGNYYDDGYSYTAPVAAFFANDYGLYDMSGNVAEWVEDAYYEASVPTVWDMNPTYNKDSEPRKVTRGGSWKDISYYCQTGTRTFEYADSAKSYIGFRCVVTYLGRSSGSEF